MAETSVPERSIEFSLVSGGPFHGVLAYLGLLGPDRLPTWRTAFVLALLAWAPPATLAIIQSLSQTGYLGWGFFGGGTVYTRYLVAIFAMVATVPFLAVVISQIPLSDLLQWFLGAIL